MEKNDEDKEMKQSSEPYSPILKGLTHFKI